MSPGQLRPLGRLAAVLSSFVALLVVLVAGPLAAAPPPAAVGTLRVDGRTLTLTQAYLFRVPDAFEATQKNAFVLLTPQPLDAKALGAATSLAAVRGIFSEGVQIEIGADGHGKIWLCHDALGKGNCYQTAFSAFDAKIESNTASRVAGSIRSFGGAEETVLETHKLLFDLKFDLSAGRDLATRR